MEHYHSKCGEVFKLRSPIIPGESCPRCKQPFFPVVMVNCECSITHEYVCDYIKEVGEEDNCPITGDPVIVKSKNSVYQDLGTPKNEEIDQKIPRNKFSFGSCLFISILAIILCFPATLWLLTVLSNTITAAIYYLDAVIHNTMNKFPIILLASLVIFFLGILLRITTSTHNWSIREKMKIIKMISSKKD